MRTPRKCPRNAVSALERRVRANLRPEDLTCEWRRASEASGIASTGQCFNATQAMYHLLGGPREGWTPVSLGKSVWPEGGPHWFLMHRPTGKRLDPTSDQYRGEPIPYEVGVPKGFPTSKPVDSRTGMTPPTPAVRGLIGRVESSPGGKQLAACARNEARRWKRR